MDMIRLAVILVVSIVSHVGSHLNNTALFRPNLPLGEYKIHLKSIFPWDPKARDKIKIYFRTNKISHTETELAGNVKCEIPFDDTLKLCANFDQKMTNGGWGTNTIMVKKEKACSTFRWFYQEKYWHTFGLNASCRCPIGTGVYTLNGIPTNNMENVLSNLPKVFPYGTYRLRVAFMKNTEYVGGFQSVVEIKRPWET